MIQGPGGKARVLSIPMRMDRALQRVALTKLAPALDQFFEESSLAYRRGLGRKRAARRLRRAFQEGYRIALRSDFAQFFDTIDHALLRDRLEAHLADGPTVELIMRWVQTGAPFDHRGVPTGAPLSPLLANLFLDRFDKETARAGTCLVRYADDFMILFKDPAHAQRVYEEARASAQALLLSLNEHKTRRVDLRAGFEFLGFSFQKTDRWTMTATDEPRPVEDLGWQQARKHPDAPTPIPLPGQTTAAIPETRQWVVFGPGAVSVRTKDGQLRCAYRDGEAETSVPLMQIREAIVLGHATVTAPALRDLTQHNIRVILADDSGRLRGELSQGGVEAQPDAIRAQLAIRSDPAWRLAIARRLIVAKITNYATLAEAMVDVGDRSVVTALRGSASKARNADSVQRLLGFEGAAAARWYRFFAMRLPHWCRFERRVAPDAEDPANILLNLAHTILHRQATLAVRLERLA